MGASVPPGGFVNLRSLTRRPAVSTLQPRRHPPVATHRGRASTGPNEPATAAMREDPATSATGSQPQRSPDRHRADSQLLTDLGVADPLVPDLRAGHLVSRQEGRAAAGDALPLEVTNGGAVDPELGCHRLGTHAVLVGGDQLVDVLRRKLPCRRFGHPGHGRLQFGGWNLALNRSSVQECPYLFVRSGQPGRSRKFQIRVANIFEPPTPDTAQGSFAFRPSG